MQNYKKNVFKISRSNSENYLLKVYCAMPEAQRKNIAKLLKTNQQKNDTKIKN